MPRYAFVIIVGALFAFYQNQLPDRYWLSLTPFVLLLAWCRPRYRELALLAAAWLWCGGLLQFHLDHRVGEDFDGRQVAAVGMIADIVEVGGDRLRFVFEPDWIENYPGRLPRRLSLNWYRSEERPRAGETWRLQLKLKRPSGYLNPGGFDYEAWLFTRGIDGLGYVRPLPQNRRLESAPALSLNAWRERLFDSLAQHCIECRHLGLIQALVLGHRGNIDPAQRKLLRDTGTAHLLAISGLHVGLIAGLCFGIGRAGWRFGFHRSGCSRAEFAAAVALTGALLYAAMAGFSLPTVRALIMLAALLLALLARQRLNLLQSIALAAIVIVIADPRSVGSISFWLSLSALAVIAMAQPRLAGIHGWWRQLLLLQVYFSLLMLPLGLLFFGQATSAGLAANLVAIPTVAFIVLPGSLLGSLLSVTGLPGSDWLLSGTDAALGVLFSYLQWLGDIGLAALPGRRLPLALVLSGGIVVVLALTPLSGALKRAAFVLAAVMLSWSPPRLAPGAFRVDVLDVGMGTSVVVQTRFHSLVYDVGPGSPSGFSAADWTLIPLLRWRGIEMPDLLVVSHVDQDHSGGLPSLVGGAVSLPLLSGTPSRLEQRHALEAGVGSCHAYPDWSWDGVRFRFLGRADPGARASTNDRSCILMIDGHHRVLLPGDIEAGQELRLVEAYADALRADIMLSPHHGSNTSSDLRFLQRVQPSYVVHTVGRGNRWKFPHAAVVQRYQAIGSRQFRSDRHGSVSFVSAAESLAWSSPRVPPRRLWRRW